MKKSAIVKSLILIIAVILNVQIMKSMHAEQASINSDRDKISSMPLASFHKFWADVKWMLYIQHMGSIDLTTEKNSKDLYDEASAILDLDPSFYKVYEISALMLSAKTPEYAIKLLERGQDTQKNRNDWRLFSMAGNIRNQETFFNKKVNKMEKIHQAIGYYREALKKPGVMPVLEKTYIKSKAQYKHGQSLKDVAAGVQGAKEIHLMVAELAEWKAHLNEKVSNPEYGIEDEGFMVNVDDDTRGNILTLIQRIRKDPKTKDDKLGKQISKDLLNSMFQNIHKCDNCYTQYQKGDRFCSNCKTGVQVFGICKNLPCSKVNRGGPFCEFCSSSNKAKKK